MEQAKLVGVGYLGKRDRMTRMLARLMESTNQVYGFSGPADAPAAFLSETPSLRGFYLGYSEKGLNLSLFPKGTGPDSGKHPPVTYSMTHKKNRLH